MAYNPSVPPQGAEDLLPFLQDELLRVAQAFNDMQDGVWEIRHSMPVRYKPGTVIYLAGKPKNPLDPSSTGSDPLGTGKEGLYRFGSDNLWHYIG